MGRTIAYCLQVSDGKTRAKITEHSNGYIESSVLSELSVTYSIGPHYL